MLYKIRKNASGVYYLYLVKVDRDKVTFVFDLDADDVRKRVCEMSETYSKLRT